MNVALEENYVSLNKELRSSQEVPEFSGNPFGEIGAHVIDRRTAISSNQMKIRQGVLSEFDTWNGIVVRRLNQLGEALTVGEKRSWLSAGCDSILNQRSLWFFFHKRARFRVHANRNEGVWNLELSGNKGPRYQLHYLVQVRFVLDEHAAPKGFFFCRGSDNRFFTTHLLSEEKFTQVLLAHFSRAGCGSNLDDDLAHLDFLCQKQQLSSDGYHLEKGNLLAEDISPRFYRAPRKSAGESIRIESRVRLLFCIICVILTASVVMFAKMKSNDYSRSTGGSGSKTLLSR